MEEVENAKRIISILGGKIIDINEYQLPMSDINRTVVIIKKEKETPQNYPRRPNQIKKE